MNRTTKRPRHCSRVLDDVSPTPTIMFASNASLSPLLIARNNSVILICLWWAYDDKSLNSFMLAAGTGSMARQAATASHRTILPGALVSLTGTLMPYSFTDNEECFFASVAHQFLRQDVTLMLAIKLSSIDMPTAQADGLVEAISPACL